MARFALYSNGKKLETLEDLKGNFTLKDMENNFRTKSLHRWLAEKGLRDGLKKIEDIPPVAEDLADLLMECFTLSDEQKAAVKQRAEDDAKRDREQDAKEKQEATIAEQKLQSNSDAFDVILLGCSRDNGPLKADRESLIKAMTECLGIGLIHARKLVGSLPRTVLKSLSLESAETTKATLERVGGIVEIRKHIEHLNITWDNNFYDSPTDYLVEKLHDLMVVGNEKIILCDGYDHFFESENGTTWTTITIADDFYCHRVKKFNDKIVFFNTLPPQYGEFYTKEGTWVSTDTNLSYWNVQHTEPAVFDFYFDGSQFWAIDFSSRVTAGIMSHMTAWDIDETVIFKDKCIAVGLRDKDQRPVVAFNDPNPVEWNTSFSSYIMTRDPEGRFHLQMTTPAEGRLKKYQHIDLVAFDDTVFMMVRGTENKEVKRTVFFSYDGESWEKLNVGFDFVVKINNVFFAYSKDSNPEGIGQIISVIYYSGDGINWKTIEPPTFTFTEKVDFGGIIVPNAKKERVKRVFLSDFIVYKDKLLGLLSNNKFVLGEVSSETTEMFS